MNTKAVRYRRRGSLIKVVTKNRGRQTIYDSIRFKYATKPMIKQMRLLRLAFRNDSIRGIGNLHVLPMQ